MDSSVPITLTKKVCLIFKKGPQGTRNDATKNQLENFNKKIQLVLSEIG